MPPYTEHMSMVGPFPAARASLITVVVYIFSHTQNTHRL